MTGSRGGADRGARHLVLVGLMGAGKSTVGARCANALGRPLVDTDELVEATTGRSVREIFAADGEAAFRALERVAVADACASPAPLVIACGGGAVLDPDSRRRLRSRGVVVWLRAEPAELAARVATTPDDRPLLQGAEPAGTTLARLAADREAAYEAAAHVAVDTSGRDADEVAAAVLEEFDRCTA